MSVCAICLGEATDDASGHYHRACLVRLFGADRCPDLDLELRTLPERVRTTHDRMSISGAQRKALLQISADRTRLDLATTDSLYIVKPQTERFGSLPENEHLSMCIARLLGMRMPEFGMIALRDSSWAFIVRRFDRSEDTPPRKRDQWDFCQLLDRPPEKKALGTAEECAGVVRKYTADPEVGLRELFLQFLGSFWLGNGDLHLKNLSLAGDDAGAIHLSPVYDIVCTALYDIWPQLLKVTGRTDDLQWTHFVQFGTQACGLSRDEVLATIEGVRSHESTALALVNRSYLPAQYRRPYQDALRKRTRALRGPTGGKPSPAT